MILEIFLPEKLFGFRILPKKILGIALNGKTATAIKIDAQRSKTIIEAAYKEPLEDGDLKSYPKRASKALRHLLSKRAGFDKVYISAPASKIIFKEVTIPLRDPEKIRKVIEYEVEEQLPFSIDEAVVDFIITKESHETEVSRVLVAAIRNTDLQAVLDVYTQAGIKPTNICVDLFSIYNTYQSIPEYKNLKDGTSLIDVGNYSTRITFIHDGSLRLIRNIPKGIITLAEEISKETGIPIEDVEYGLKNKILSRIGNKEQEKAIQKHLINYLNDIQFTLNSFSLKLSFYKEIQKILFTYFDPHSSDFSKFASNVLQTPCIIFEPNKIFETKEIKNKIRKSIDNWNDYGHAVSTALTSNMPIEFNFRRKNFIVPNLNLLRKQINAGIFLTVSSFILMLSFGYLQIKNLSEVSEGIELREIGKLKRLLKSGQKITQDEATLRLIKRALIKSSLQPMFKDVSNIVSMEEVAWLGLDKLKVSSLEILEKLTEIIDRQSFDIKVYEVLITPEDNESKATLSGLLKSKVIGEDWSQFAKFTQIVGDLSKDKQLVSEITVDDSLGEDGGAKFKLTLKTQKDSV